MWRWVISALTLFFPLARPLLHTRDSQTLIVNLDLFPALGCLTDMYMDLYNRHKFNSCRKHLSCALSLIPYRNPSHMTKRQWNISSKRKGPLFLSLLPYILGALTLMAESLKHVPALISSQHFFCCHYRPCITVISEQHKWVLTGSPILSPDFP